MGLTVLLVLLLLSFCGVVCGQVDWGYGWNNEPSVSSTPVATATSTPTATPSPLPTSISTPTSSNVDSITTIPPTQTPTATQTKIPELSFIFVLLGLVAVSFVVVVFYRRKPK